MKSIEPPTRQEVRREVDQILSRAQLTERRFFPLVFRMLRNVGLINTFRGVGWAPPLCLLVGWFFSLFTSTGRGNWVQISILLPLALTGVNTLVCVAEKKQEVWELKETCRYNGKYLLALRMLFLGLWALPRLPVEAAWSGSCWRRFPSSSAGISCWRPCGSSGRAGSGQPWPFGCFWGAFWPRISRFSRLYGFPRFPFPCWSWLRQAPGSCISGRQNNWPFGQ